MKSLGIVLAILGVVGLAIFALADVLGLGADPDSFGARQTTGIVISAIALLLGLLLATRSRKAPGDQA